MFLLMCHNEISVQGTREQVPLPLPGRLVDDSTCNLKAEPGKLDIKRHKPGILFISLPIVSLVKLTIMM